MPDFRQISVFLFFIFSNVVWGQVGIGWVRVWNGPGSGNDHILAMTVDVEGNIYAAGYSVNPATVQDIVVLKYSPDGNLLWSALYDYQGLADYSCGIVVDRNGNVYVCGYVTGSQTGMDFVTIKYNSNGVLQWANRYNGSANATDFAFSIALDSSGNVYVTGFSNNGATGDDFTTIKYNPNGVQQWVATSARPNIDRAQFLTVDNNGNVYVLGYVLPGPDLCLIKYNTNGVQQWLVTYNGSGNGADYPTAISLDRNGNCYLTGYSWGAGSANMDYVTFKYAPDGSQVWLRRYNSPGDGSDYPFGLVVTDDGQVYVSGYTRSATGITDLVTIKYNSPGNQQWVQVYDSGSNEYTLGLAIDRNGNIYVTGYRDGLNYDCITISYAPDGSRRWVTTYNGAGNGNDVASVVKTDRWGNVYVGGFSSGGTGNGDDCLVIKYIQPDVAVQRVLRPRGFFDTAAVIYPQAMVANKSTAPVDFWSFCKIGRLGGAVVYTDSVFVSGLGVGESTVVNFREWVKPHLPGQYFVQCSTYRVNDGDLSNNVAQELFFIVSGPYGWLELKPVPELPSGKAVRDGASLTYSSALNRIYAIKGGKTADFYYYSPGQGDWVIMPSVPDGPSGKPPGKGACLASDEEGNVYLVRGNSTFEFWRYGNSTGWSELAPIPRGSGNPVKGGSDAVYVIDDGCIYFLKGHRNEFYRYRIGADLWENLPPAPGTKWGKGSFIVFDYDSLCIYACRAKYNELWRFDLRTGTWDTLRIRSKMPVLSKTGKSAKLKEGGCGAYFERSIYAFKGANTNQFFRYDIDGDSWVEIDTIPTMGVSGRSRGIKAGADLVQAGDAFYALKGNKTLEFWRYAVPPVLTGANDHLLSGVESVRSYRLIEPKQRDNGSVFRGLVRIKLPKGDARYVTGVVYDPAGRRRAAGKYWLRRDGIVELDLTSLQPGVYFIGIKYGDQELNRRIVLTR